MPEANLEIGSPIKEFIEKTKKETIDGLGDWELKAPVELELSAVVSGKVGGGIDIQVVNFGAKVEAEQVQKVKLSIGPKDEALEAEKRARIEKATGEMLRDKLNKKAYAEKLLRAGEHYNAVAEAFSKKDPVK